MQQRAAVTARWLQSLIGRLFSAGGRLEMQWPVCPHHLGACAATVEIAIGEAEARNRAAEAVIAGAVDVEARLERNAAQRGAILVAVHPQPAGWQHHLVDGAAADPD